MKNVFKLNPAAPTESIIDALYEKTAQAKAVAECILLAITSKTLETHLLYDGVWAIDSFLSQIKELQEHLELFGGLTNFIRLANKGLEQ